MIEPDTIRFTERAGAPEPALRFILLGPFSCWRDGALIPFEAWRTRHTRSVLRILLDERDRPLPADRLIEAVWPDADPASARNSLQVAIRTARLALEPNLARGSDSRYIRTTPEGYRFDSTGCVIDVDEFNAAFQQGLAADRRGDRDGATRFYREAAALYRGEYHADDPYAEWAFGTRERLQSRYLATLDRLSALAFDNSEWDAAIIWIDRALAVDPLWEDLYQRLMRCHAAQDRRSHALAAFERCRRLLQSELGVEPSTETLQLRNQIASEQARPLPVIDQRRGLGSPSDLRLPFVGRRAERRAMERAWNMSQSEPGFLVEVTGSPGIGKTSLVRQNIEEFAQGMTAGGQAAVRTHWISCYEGEATVPFAPLVRLVANWLERSSTLGERRRLTSLTPVLGRLLPQVAALELERSFNSPEVLVMSESSQLLEALTQTVLVLNGGGPGVLVLDDIHWADPSTVLWLGYALRRLPSGLLTIVTRRSSEPVSSALHQFISMARRSNRLLELPLGPLSDRDVEDLLATGLHDPCDVLTLAHRLQHVARGQPLLLIEALRSLISQGALYPDDNDQWRMADRVNDHAWDRLSSTETVRAMIADRVGRLDGAARDVFTAVCVIGAECDARLIARSTGHSSEAALAALDTLLARQLLLPTDDGQRYVVEHPLIQRTVYESLSPARRQHWHLRVAAALEQSSHEQPGPAVSGQTLQHLIAGNAPTADIVRVAELAGDHAMRAHAYASAIEAFGAARDLLTTPAMDDATRAHRARISEALAGAFAGAARWGDAITQYEELIAAATDPLERSRFRRELAAVLGDVHGHFDEALQLLDAAEQELSAFDHSVIAIERGRIDAARAVACFYQGEYEAVVAHGERALATWRGQPGIEREEIELIRRIGQTDQRLGRLDDAETRFRAAVARSRAIGDRLLEARCLDSFAGLIGKRGRPAEAVTIHQESVDTAREIGAATLENIATVNLAVALTYLGEFAAARAAYEEVVERATALDTRYTVMHAQVSLGEVLVRLGLVDRARDVLEQGISLAREIGNRQRIGHAWLHLADLELHLGNPAAALAYAEAGISNGRQISDVHSLREGSPVLARALVALERARDAERAAVEGLDASRSGGFRTSEGRNLVALGLVRAALGDCPAVEDALAEAERIFRESGARYDLADTLHVRATTVLDGCERAAALTEAATLARATGARLLGNKIAQAMKKDAS